jgi:two-component system, response regulator FlrC
MPVSSPTLAGTKPASLLVVDDDELTRSLMVSVLREAGYEVVAADSGFAALERLQRSHFDLVLTDKNMTGLDGHTLVNEIWLRHPSVGTVMITGFRNDESEQRAREQRVLAYLEKPIYDLRSVPRTVATALVEHKKRMGLG